MNNILEVTTAQIVSVYCGCKGKYRYNSMHVEVGAARRGYAVTKSDVNDRQVASVLRMLQADASNVEYGTDLRGNGVFTLRAETNIHRAFVL